MMEDPYAATMRRLGRGSVAAGCLAMLIVAFSPGLDPSDATAPTLALALALTILVATGLGTARLLFPGNEGRTWWGIGLALTAGGIATLVWAPSWFPTVFFAAAGGLHLVANLAASARIARERYVDASQQRWQLGLVWLLPVVGVVLISAFYRSQDDPWRRDGYSGSESEAGFFG